MTTLRVTFYLLLALNLVCGVVIAMPWLGMQEPFLGATEPARMTSQVFPERLRVLRTSTEPPSADSAGPLPTIQPESAPVAEPVSAPVASVTPVVEASAPVAAAPADSAATVCVAFRNLSGAQAQTLAQRARVPGGNLTVREEAPVPSSYWVNIPPQGGKAGADRRAAELRELGLEDFFVVQDAGDNRFAISLGLFRAESLAQRQLETLQKRGVKGATVTARENANGARVELIGPGAQIERVAREAVGDIQGALRDTCKSG
jgi:hypothetical protein